MFSSFVIGIFVNACPILVLGMIDRSYKQPPNSMEVAIVELGLHLNDLTVHNLPAGAADSTQFTGCTIT